MELDAVRKKLNAPREAIRERYLAKERAKQEQEAVVMETVTSGECGLTPPIHSSHLINLCRSRLKEVQDSQGKEKVILGINKMTL